MPLGHAPLSRPGYFRSTICKSYFDISAVRLPLEIMGTSQEFCPSFQRLSPVVGIFWLNKNRKVCLAILFSFANSRMSSAGDRATRARNVKNAGYKAEQINPCQETL